MYQHLQANFYRMGGISNSDTVVTINSSLDQGSASIFSGLIASNKEKTNSSTLAQVGTSSFNGGLTTLGIIQRIKL